MLFGQATYYFISIVVLFSNLSIVYASIIAIIQADIKRIIAYSSIAHMNSVVLGIFSGNIEGLLGSIILMIAHGIASSGLFFIVGNLYQRLGTRLLAYYGGLGSVMPNLSLQFLVFCLANIGIPGSFNFIGEVCLLSGLVDINFISILVPLSGTVLGVLHTMSLFNKIIFGNINKRSIKSYKDLSHVEFLILLPLFLLIIILGIFPDLILDTIATSVFKIIEKTKYVNGF